MTGPNLHLDPTVGCFFAGILLSMIFYGVTVAQVLFYAWEYPEDRWWMKFIVILLFILDTVITMLDLNVLWGYTVTNHGNPLALSILTNSFVAEYSLSAFTVLFVQCWYMRNIWQFLAQRWYQIPLTVSCLILAVTSCACSLGSVYLGLFDRVLPGIFAKTKVPAGFQTVSASVADMYITALLTLSLHGERTGFSRTETLIRKLITYAINRGALTTALQIGQFITYIALPDATLGWIIFHFVGCKVYVNSMLATLNARHYLRAGGGSGGPIGGVSVQDFALDNLRRHVSQGGSKERRLVPSAANNSNALTYGSALAGIAA